MLVKYAIETVPSTQFVEMNCSATSAAKDLIELMESNSLAQQGKNGKLLRPRGADRAVYLIRGQNLPKLDKWGTNALGAFLTQVIQRQSYYNSNRELVSIENIKFVITLNPTRGHLEERLSAVCQILVIDQPPESDISEIATYLWKQIFPKGPYNELGEASASAFVQLSNALGPKEAQHYNFSIAHLAAWAENCRGYQSKNYWSLWRFEAERIFRDRLINSEHQSVFDSCFSGISDRFTSDLYFPEHDGIIKEISEDDLKIRLMDVAKNFTREVVDLPEGGLVVSQQLLSSIVNVSTQLCNKDGHLVLIGSPGSGRRTSVQISAYFQSGLLIT